MNLACKRRQCIWTVAPLQLMMFYPPVACLTPRWLKDRTHDATLRATLHAMGWTRCNCCVKCCRSRTCFYSCNIARNIACNVASCVRSFSPIKHIIPNLGREASELGWYELRMHFIPKEFKSITMNWNKSTVPHKASAKRKREHQEDNKFPLKRKGPKQLWKLLPSVLKQ